MDGGGCKWEDVSSRAGTKVKLEAEKQDAPPFEQAHQVIGECVIVFWTDQDNIILHQSSYHYNYGYRIHHKYFTSIYLDRVGK